MAYNLETRSGHNMFTMASLLQKAIRRGDKERAGYAAMELFGSYHSMLWNRIMTVSCEDCWGILAKEIVALRYTDDVRNRNRKGYEKDTQYVSEAITLLFNSYTGMLEHTDSEELLASLYTDMILTHGERRENEERFIQMLP